MSEVASYHAPQPVFLSVVQVSRRYGCAVSTVWRWVAEGEFPTPIKLRGLTRWRVTDLEAWERSRERTETLQAVGA